jgi:phosphoenolpyruvate carboxylase
MGVPPELLGLDALSGDEIEYLKESYVNFDSDLQDAFKFYNVDSPYIPEWVMAKVNELALDMEIDESHKTQTDHIIQALRRNSDENING